MTGNNDQSTQEVCRLHRALEQREGDRSEAVVAIRRVKQMIGDETFVRRLVNIVEHDLSNESVTRIQAKIGKIGLHGRLLAVERDGLLHIRSDRYGVKTFELWWADTDVVVAE